MRERKKQKGREIAFLLVFAIIVSLIKPSFVNPVFAIENGNDDGTAVEATAGDAAPSASDGLATGDAVAEGSDQQDVSAKTLSVRVEESGCNITINAPEGSIPYPYEELSVSAREITEGSAEYDYYLSQSAEALECDSADNISFARFFDIEIMRNGEKIEPLSPVEVKIEYDDAPVITDDAELSIVHFAEEGTEVIDDIEINDDATEIVYEQESFSVTATIVTGTPELPENKYGKTYVLVAKYNDKYYSVQLDGTLREISNSGNEVTAKDYVMWTYAKIDDKYYLRYVNEGYDYNNLNLPENWGYTYIDPAVEDGLSIDTPIEGTHKPTQFNTRLGLCNVTLDGLGHVKCGDKFLSVNADGSKIIGNSQDGGNVLFYLAKVENLDDFQRYNNTDPYGLNMAANHQVNHIDISVVDTVTAKFPLAYGPYYDENGELLFTVTEPYDLYVTQSLDVTQATIRDAKIKAYDKSGHELNNAFIITGYSSNPADQNENTTQVRIEGVFKISTIAPTDADNPNGKADVNTARINNPVSYSLTAEQRDIEFRLETSDKKQIYDSQGKPLVVSADVFLSKDNIKYFDFTNNTCPILHDGTENENTNESKWKNGVILRTGTSGMDYKLVGPANIRMEYEPVVAINVSNDIRDSQGNIIKLKPATQLDPIKFNVKENTENPDPESVKGKNVGSYQNFEAETSNYNSNINHEIQTVIDQTGAVLVNDYSVKQGMVYVEEDISTVPKTIIDVEGNTWIYRYSYIETEYVYRNDGNENKLHVSDKSTSGFSKAVPEVLGDHYIGGVNEFNTFVEFFAHNVYDKVIPPTKEEVNPYEGNGELGGVKVGDEIEYKVTYTNYASIDETVTITDTLDKNVEFVSASDNGSYDEASHTVTWTLKDVEAGKEGSVTLTVKVLESALESNGGPGKVFNGGSGLEGADPANTSKASVKVGNDPEQKLEEVENPVPETPVKKEISPYKGTGELGPVKDGDTITYEISYKNYKSTAADVTIVDTLDKNVEFVSASDNGSYDEASHTVTWTLEDVEAGKEGSVTLTVKVLESALESNGGPGKVFNGGSGLEGADPANTSKASVKVGNDPEQKLEEVENPVPETPVKKEISPYKGTGELGPVKDGDTITYEISYKNYKGTAADVTIVDTLDKNVEFVSASDNGSYDKASHTVTWTLKDVKAGKEGSVTLTVKVLKSALESNGGPGKVFNGGSGLEGADPANTSKATVKVGDDKEFILEQVENPVDEELGNLIITVTEKDTGRDVPGAKVEVKYPNDDTITYTTDEAGKITLKDIPVGDYTIIIRKVPDGYNVVTDEVLTAKVVAGSTTTREFKIVTTTDTVVKTGDTAPISTFVLLMIVSLAGIAVLAVMRRKRDEE